MTKHILELSKYLPQIRDVFGLKVYASSSVSPSKVDHAAAVLAEYIDNDQDGVVDEQKVVDSLLAFKSGMVIHENEAEEVKNMENYSNIIKEHGVFLKDLYEIGIKPVGSRFFRGSFEPDNSIEEILHMITVRGYSYAYPDTFGFEDSSPGGEVAGVWRETSRLSKAARIARGGIDDDARDSYPEHAWYRRYDEGCFWGCIVNEYIYWGLVSYLGGLNHSCMDFDQVCDDHLDAGSAFFNEWELNTSEKIKDRDKALYKILTSEEYKLPSILPNGKYSPRVIKDVITGSKQNDLLRGSKGDDYLLGGGGNDKILGSQGNDVLDGGSGNDKINGGRGEDKYILSTGKDKFQGVKLREDDVIEIDSNIDFKLTSFKKHSKIIHDDGVTTVGKVGVSDLSSIIVIV